MKEIYYAVQTCTETGTKRYFDWPTAEFDDKHPGGNGYCETYAEAIDAIKKHHSMGCYVYSIEKFFKIETIFT